MAKFCNHGLVMLDIFGCQVTFILRLVYLLLTPPSLVEKHFFLLHKIVQNVGKYKPHNTNYSPFLNSWWIFPSVVDRCVDFFLSFDCCHINDDIIFTPYFFFLLYQKSSMWCPEK